MEGLCVLLGAAPAPLVVGSVLYTLWSLSAVAAAAAGEIAFLGRRLSAVRLRRPLRDDRLSRNADFP